MVLVLCLINLAMLSPLGPGALARAYAPTIAATVDYSRPNLPTPPAPAPEPEPSPAPAPVVATRVETVAPVPPTPVPVAPQPAPKPPQPAPVAEVAVAPAPQPASAPSDSVEFSVILTTTFKNVGTDDVRSGEVTLPLMSTMQSPSQVILWERLTPAAAVSEDELGNRWAKWTLGDVQAGQALVIRQEYRIRAWGESGGGPNGPVLPAHIQPAAKVESAAPEIAALAARLTAGLPSVEAQVTKLIAYTREALRYDANSPAKNQGALAGLSTGSGVCEEYASLFVALCRAAGIPARVVNGWGRDVTSARTAWPQDANLRLYRHAWAEAFIPALGWVTVDPTFNRASAPGLTGKPLPAGILITDNYGDRSITGRYSGGKLEVTRDHRLSW